MLIEEIAEGLREKLRLQPISSRTLLDRLRMLDENSRHTSQYQDPRYLPFYYYLSKFVTPKSLLHVGLDLALQSCCFLMGCASVDRFLGFQAEGRAFYSPRMAFSNIKDVRHSGISIEYHYGRMIDSEMESKMSLGFDMVLLTSKMNDDELNEALDVCWNRLNMDGMIVVDHVSDRKLFKAFCKAKNRPHISFDTRYGAAATQK